MMVRAEEERHRYGDAPCIPELIAIVGVGALHVVLELAASVTAATIYNSAVCVAVIGYLVWRARRSPGVLRAWGMRLDNLGRALAAQLAFVAVAALPILAYGYFTGRLPLPGTFWLTAAFYPLWGTAQQFALQILVARNLTGLLTRPWPLALAAAALFAVSHVPQYDLVLLTFLGGTGFTILYRRQPNLWAVGLAHGLLGALAYYLVVGRDPGATILGLFSGG